MKSEHTATFNRMSLDKLGWLIEFLNEGTQVHNAASDVCNVAEDITHIDRQTELVNSRS